MITSALIYVITLPLMLAAVSALLTRRMRATPRIVWSAGVGVGYIAGHFGMKCKAGAWPAVRLFFRPLEARDWVPHAVLLAMAVTIVVTYAPQAWRRWIGWIAGLLTIGVPIRLLSGNVAQRLAMPEKLSYLALLAATFGLVWLLLGLTNDDEPSLLRPMLVAIVAAGSAVVLTLAGSLMIGQSCGMVASALAGTGLVAMSQGRASGFGGAAGVVTFSLGSLIMLGHFYAELSAANGVLLLVALVAAGGPMPEAIRTGSNWFDAAIRVLLCSIPLGAAILGSLS